MVREVNRSFKWWRLVDPYIYFTRDVVVHYIYYVQKLSDDDSVLY